jgi:hypothetical protein
MGVNNHFGSQDYSTRRVAKSMFGTVQLPDAAAVLTVDFPTIVRMVPTAARNIDLPAALDGLMIVVVNGAAATNALTVRLTGAGATVGTVAAAKTSIFFCVGTTWHVLTGA